MENSCMSSVPDKVVSVSLKDMPMILRPGPWDVLCNRSPKAFNHTGNRRFRLLVENHASAYAKLQTKSERSFMVLSIVRTVQSAGGNFITKTRAGNWEKVTPTQAKEKVGHALRAAVSALGSDAPRSVYNVIGEDQDGLGNSMNKFLTLEDLWKQEPSTTSLADIFAEKNRTDEDDLTADSLASSSTRVATEIETEMLDDLFFMDLPSGFNYEDPDIDTETADNVLADILNDLDQITQDENIFAC